MDTTRDIIYRNVKLNDAAIAFDASDGLGKGITGSVVDDFDPDDVDVVQFSEKRAEADGLDVGTPFLGGRRIRINGTVYGKTRALCYDNLWQLRAALSPTLASREIPGDKGYLPMYFAVPTNNLLYAGAIAMRALVMPKSFRAPINRDQHGGTDGDALAISWSSLMVMRDPLFEGQTPQNFYFTDTVITSGATATASTDLVNKVTHGLVAGDRVYLTALTGGTGLALNTSYYVPSAGLTTGAFKVSLTAGTGGAPVNIATDYSSVSFAKFQTITGDFLNRGTYNAPLNMLFAVGPQAGAISVATAGSSFTITIPASTGNRIIRVKRDKIITVEEGGIESLRRSWLTFQQSTTWPLIPAGTSGYTVTINGCVLDPGTTDGSHMWFWESYA